MAEEMIRPGRSNGGRTNPAPYDGGVPEAAEHKDRSEMTRHTKNYDFIRIPVFIGVLVVLAGIFWAYVAIGHDYTQESMVLPPGSMTHDAASLGNEERMRDAAGRENRTNVIMPTEAGSIPADELNRMNEEAREAGDHRLAPVDEPGGRASKSLQ